MGLVLLRIRCENRSPMVTPQELRVISTSGLGGYSIRTRCVPTNLKTLNILGTTTSIVSLLRHVGRMRLDYGDSVNDELWPSGPFGVLITGTEGQCDFTHECQITLCCATLRTEMNTIGYFLILASRSQKRNGRVRLVGLWHRTLGARYGKIVVNSIN